MVDYIAKEVNGKLWLWFKSTNNYLQLDRDVFRVFKQLQQTNSIEEVILWCAAQYSLPIKEARKTVSDIDALFTEQLNEKIDAENEVLTSEMPESFYKSKIYRFNGVDFRVFYSNSKIETIFHPLFAHLEISDVSTNAFHLKLFQKDEVFGLNYNNKTVGLWSRNEEHLFKGQVYMAMLNKAYSKTEQDWMGVLHASAIGDDKSSILFLGDSGKGKSTASAIALASGLSLIADDFVPIDTEGRVLAFPAAISVKKQALEFLSIRFPELLKAKEYELKAMNKTVRYLAPKINKDNPSREVKALVFIHYTTEVDFEIEVLDKHKAFQYLVVDSWLSPEEENARFFLDWIADLPSYRLRYSNSQKMLDAVHKLLEDE